VTHRPQPLPDRPDHDSMAGMATTTGTGRMRTAAIITIVAGIVFIVAGVLTYFTVSSTLADQKITVAEDADHFSGQDVTQPWTAYAQANVIAKHANEIAGGKTYAELPRDDPNRATVMTASFLQASLFTSVVAFGVAVMAVGLGIVMLVIGWGLLPQKVVEEQY
jgi:ABC-type antimicrobial peptide transport system permease subunit